MIYSLFRLLSSKHCWSATTVSLQLSQGLHTNTLAHTTAVHCPNFFPVRSCPYFLFVFVSWRVAKATLAWLRHACPRTLARQKHAPDTTAKHPTFPRPLDQLCFGGSGPAQQHPAGDLPDPPQAPSPGGLYDTQSALAAGNGPIHVTFRSRPARTSVCTRRHTLKRPVWRKFSCGPRRNPTRSAAAPRPPPRSPPRPRTPAPHASATPAPLAPSRCS